MSTEQGNLISSPPPEEGLVCPQCGEWIPFSGAPHQVDCLSCGAMLRLNVAARRARDQIRWVDSLWEESRKPFLVQNRYGEWVEPQTVPIGLILLLIPGLMFVMIGAAAGQPGWMIVGAAILASGIGFSARKWKKLENFRRERRRYEADRNKWLMELGRAQRDYPPKNPTRVG